MVLFEKRQQSSEKGGKKDASIFGKEPRLSPGNFAQRSKEDRGGNIFGKTKFGREKREDLAKKAYLPQIMGSNIDQEDIGKGIQELEKGRYGRYGKLSPAERKELKKFFGASSEKKT